MSRLSAIVGLVPALLLGAATAGAAEYASGARLVPGGAGLTPEAWAAPAAAGESRTPLVQSGHWSVGSVSAPSAAASSANPLPFGRAGAPLAAGGYVAWGGNEARLSSSVKGGAEGRGLDLSATVNGGAFGLGGSSASLSLGLSRRDLGGISPNPNQPGLALTTPGRTVGDVNMSLNLFHQVTPSFTVGGMAAAGRGESEKDGTGLMVGAGLGYKF